MKPDEIAKRLLEIANTTEAGADGRIDVGQVNIVFLREGGKARRLPGRHRVAEGGWHDRHAPQRYILPLHRKGRAAVCLI